MNYHNIERTKISYSHNDDSLQWIQNEFLPNFEKWEKNVKSQSGFTKRKKKEDDAQP